MSNSQFKCIYLKNGIPLINFLFHFWNLHQISNILKKKIMVIANVFLKLQTVKNFVRPLCKKRRFGTRFDTQHDKVSQILAEFPCEHFYHVFFSFWEKLVWNISPVLLGEILGMFLNTLSADGKYPIRDWENLPLAMQMQLSEKRKTFLQFFVPFMDSASNFKHFEKKRCSPYLTYFRSYRLWKSWLEQSLKIAVSENALTVNIRKCHKYLLNPHNSTFIIFFHLSEGIRFGKYFP